MAIKYLTEDFRDYICEARWIPPNSTASHIYRHAVLRRVAQRMNIGLESDGSFVVARWRLYGVSNTDELQVRAQEMLEKIRDEVEREFRLAEEVMYYVLTYAEWKEKNQ